MKVLILNLKRQYESIKEEVDAAITGVLSGQNFILGAEVSRLEEQVSSYCSTRHAIGVGSGTDALLLALKGAGIGPGDEVITTPFTFVATADTIMLAGARPVFVDIDPDTFNINVDRLRDAITDKTRAIVPVHLYGQSCEMDAITSVASSAGIKVIEDVAQAFGGNWGGRVLGAIGTAGCFSFFPSKNLGCFGDGGMVITSDDEVAETVRMLRKHGGRDKYNVEILGHNSRLDTLQAAVLLVKLKYIERWNESRRAVACAYDSELSGIDGLQLPVTIDNAYHVYHQYTIKTNRRDELQSHLKQNGIGSMVYYPVALHAQKLFKDSARISGTLECAEQAAAEVLSLPIDPLQSEEETQYVITKIKEFFA